MMLELAARLLAAAPAVDYEADAAQLVICSAFTQTY